MGGGLANRYPNGQIAPKGAGTPMPTNIPEPLRVFRISDGAHLASAGGYFGAGNAHGFDWSPIRSLIGFLDAYPDLYLWDPQAILRVRNVSSSERRQQFCFRQMENY
jgi:hypothetical protein